MIQACSHQSTI